MFMKEKLVNWRLLKLKILWVVSLSFWPYWICENSCTGSTKSNARISSSKKCLPVDISIQHKINFLTLGYGKTISHVVVGLKTAKGSKQLKLDPSIFDSFQKEKVEIGDVIYIEANSGAVKVKISSFISSK